MSSPSGSEATTFATLSLVLVVPLPLHSLEQKHISIVLKGLTVCIHQAIDISKSNFSATPLLDSHSATDQTSLHHIMLNILNRNKGNSPTTPVDSKGKVKANNSSNTAKSSSKKKSSSSSSLGGEGKAVKAKKSGAKNGIKANKSGSGGKKNKTKKDDKKPSSSGSLDRNLMMKSNSSSHSPSKPSKRIRPAKADDFVKKTPARHNSLEDLMAIKTVVDKFESEAAQNRTANSKLAEMSTRSSCGSNVRIRSLNDGSRGRGRGGGDGLDTRSEHIRRSRSSSRGPINGRGGGRSAGLDSKSDHRPRSMSRGPKGNRGRGGGPGGLDSKSEHIRRDKTPLSRRAGGDKPPSTPSRSRSLEGGLFELSPISALEKRNEEKKETIELKKQVEELQGQLQSQERQNKALQTVNDNLQSKLRTQKLDHERLVEERDKEIKELNDTVEKIMGVPSGGRSGSLFGGGNTGGSSDDDDLSKIKEEKNQLEIKYKVSEDNLQKQQDDYEAKMQFKDETIDHLMKELARMKQKGSNIDGSEHGRKAPGRTFSGDNLRAVADMGNRTGSFGNLANYASAAWDKVSPGALRDQTRHQRLSREERKRMGVTPL